MVNKIIYFIMLLVMISFVSAAVDVYPYATNPLNASHYWRINEADSAPYTVEDFIGSLDMTGSGASILGQAELIDDLGLCGLTNGDNENVLTADHTNWAGLTTYSLCFWSQQTDTSGGNRFIIGQADIDTDMVFMAYQEGGKLKYYMGTVGANEAFTFNSYDIRDELTHICVTFNNGLVQTFRNGTNLENHTYTQTSLVNDNVYFGFGDIRTGASSEYAREYVDEVLFFTHEVSTYNISKIFAGDYSERETLPPTYSNVFSSGTNKTNTLATVQATWLDETALSGWHVETNMSGFYTNFTGNMTWGASNQSVYNILINRTQGTHIGWRIFANDTSGNWNNTPYNTIVVLNTQPNTVTVFNVSSLYRNNANTSIGWAEPADPDSGDTVEYFVWWNNTVGDVSLLTNGTNNYTSTNFGPEGTYHYWVGTFDGQERGSNSSVQTIVYDKTAPVLTWYSPTAVNTLTTATTYLINASCTDENEVWSLNISVLNASNYMIASMYAENVSNSTFMNYTIATLNHDQNHTVIVRCFDSHTQGEDLLDYSYDVNTAELTFFNKNTLLDQYKFEFGYYLDGEVYKVKADQITNFDIKLYTWKNNNDYNFGALFDLPDANFRFGFRFPDAPFLKLAHPETGHFIVHDRYYADFDAMVCEYDGGLNNCIFANPNLRLVNGNWYVYYSLVDPLGEAPYSDDLRDYFSVGARLAFLTRSTGALNEVEETRYIYKDAYPTYAGLQNNASTTTKFLGNTSWSVLAQDTNNLVSYTFWHNSTNAGVYLSRSGLIPQIYLNQTAPTEYSYEVGISNIGNATDQNLSTYSYYTSATPNLKYIYVNMSSNNYTYMNITSKYELIDTATYSVACRNINDASWEVLYEDYNLAGVRTKSVSILDDCVGNSQIELRHKLEVTDGDDEARLYEAWLLFNNGTKQYNITETAMPTVPHAYICAYFNITDNNGYSNITNSSCYTVANTPPGMPTLVLPANNSITYTNETVFDWGAPSDYDSDPITNYTLLVSNSSSFEHVEFNTSVATSAYTLTAAQSLSDGGYYWLVNATDGYDYGLNSNWYYFVVNTSFGTASQAKNCTVCYNTNDILFNVTASSSNIQDIWFHSNYTGEYVNYSSGITNISLTYYYTVYSGNLSNQEYIGWQWIINSTMGTLVSSDMQFFNISNRAPTQATPIINSSLLGNTTDEDLSCYAAAQSDLDGDTLSTFYRWYRDSVRQNLTSQTIWSGNTSQGDSWLCEVITSDGYSNSTAANSTTLTVYDIIYPTWSNFINNASNVTGALGQVNWSVNLYDNKALSTYTFSTNITGSWVTDSAVSISGNSSIASVVKTVYLSNAYICGRFNFTDSSNNENSTNLSCFRSTSAATPTGLTLTFRENETVQFRLNDVQLYINKSQIIFTAYASNNFTVKVTPDQYNFSGAWANTAYAIDDDWTYTEYASCSAGSIANLTLNYTVTNYDYNYQWEVRSYNNYTNLSMSSCGMLDNKIQLEVRSLFGYDGLSGTQWYCKDSDGNQVLLLNDSEADISQSKAGIREEQLWAVYRSYPSQVNISINGDLQYYNVSEWNTTNTPATISLNRTYLNNIYASNCSCTNCTYRNGNCSVLLDIYSDSRGVLSYTKDFVVLGEYNNCTGSVFAIPSNATALNISFYDNNDAVKNINYESTADYVLSSYTGNNSLFQDNINTIKYCVYPYWARFSVDQQVQYYDSVNDVYYSYALNDYPVSNTTQYLSLYTQNGTTSVLFTVQDLDGDPIANSYIHVLKYDVGTGTYTTTEILQTDSQGQALGNIVLYTTFYNFLIYYNGELVYTENAVKLITTTRTFRIDLDGTAWSDNFQTALGLEYDLYFNEDTENFVFTYADDSGTIHFGCMKVSVSNSSGTYDLADTCTESASGSVVYNIIPANDSTFTATGYVKFDDNIYLITAQKVYEAVNQFMFKLAPQLSIFINLLFIIIMFMIGLPHPTIALTLMSTGLIFTSILGMWAIAPIYVGGIIFFAVVHMMIAKNRG